MVPKRAIKKHYNGPALPRIAEKPIQLASAHLRASVRHPPIAEIILLLFKGSTA